MNNYEKPELIVTTDRHVFCHEFPYPDGGKGVGRVEWKTGQGFIPYAVCNRCNKVFVRRMEVN